MVNEAMSTLGRERSAIRELFEYGNRRAQEIGRENVFDFSLGNPNVPAPDCVREEAERLLREVPAEVLHGYTSAAGDPSVRKAVADHIAAQTGIAMPAELIYMTCGAAASLTVTLTALCEPGDEVIVLAPYFPEYKVFIERAGATVREVETDGRFHLNFERLEQAVNIRTKAVILNSPNNPTGVVYTREELERLAGLLARKEEEKGDGIWLIADEPYREIAYRTEVPFPMQLYKNTVVCYSFSKSLSLAGERIGYIAVNPRMQDAQAVFSAVCGAGRSLGYVCAPSLFQRVAAKCLGKTADLTVYAENRDLMYGALTQMGFECIQPDGAFYLFMKSPLPEAKEFCERAKRYELLLVPSDSFGIGGYVRIAYCVSQEMIKRSLPAFEKLAKECL